LKSISDLAARCIRCGFCIESCPTFAETGEETESPRGRIYLIRSAEAGKMPWREVRPHLDACLGCRACETACPSGVEYGALLELAREQTERAQPHRTKRALLRGLTNPQQLALQLTLGRLWPRRRLPALLSRLLSGAAAEADLPRFEKHAPYPPLAQGDLPALRGTVALLQGCAMRTLFPRVHDATRRLLRRVGYAVSEVDFGCCGALHAHAGYLEEGEAMARRALERLPKDMPLIVNSAGCGSFLKDCRQGQEILDVTEFLLREGLTEALAQTPGYDAVATYHDACHLAHGQGVRSQPRELLRAVPNLRLVELPESDRCCGSAGIYNLTQPRMARRLLNRKWRNVESTEAQIVVTGNPGCHAWIEQASRENGGRVRILHTAEALEAAFSGLP
jgi:glycolate oxidase iron-sulfur subunit